MKENNGGYSLIELVVVICIVAILATTFLYNVGRVSGYNAKETRQKIVSSLENGQTLTLSKSRGGINLSSTDTYMVFFKNGTDGCNYCMTIIEGKLWSIKKISKSNVTISYSNNVSDGAGSAVSVPVIVTGVKNLSTNNVSDDMAETISDSGTKVGFDRQNGAFLPDDSGAYIYKFFANAGKYSYEISLHPKTGKVEMGERTRLDE